MWVEGKAGREHAAAELVALLMPSCSGALRLPPGTGVRGARSGRRAGRRAGGWRRIPYAWPVAAACNKRAVGWMQRHSLDAAPLSPAPAMVTCTPMDPVLANKQVYSVDAPLKLQEKWVEQLVADFKLRESDLSRRLQYDLARAQSLLPPDFHAWDAELAAAVQAREQQEGPGHRDQASGTGEDPPLSAVTAFKVSRALAAALVPFERSQDAFGLQASLQPLKYGLFARRARHLVLQVSGLMALELCLRRGLL